MTIILVFAGGILGGITRYLLGKALPPSLGTLIANMCACLTLGISARLFEAHPFAYAAGGAGFPRGAPSPAPPPAPTTGGLAALQLGLTIGTIMT
jgi:CrcB-like protein